MWDWLEMLLFSPTEETTEDRKRDGTHWVIKHGAIVSSLRHNDLIKLHLEDITDQKLKNNRCWKPSAEVLRAPAHLLTRLAVMLRICAEACTNCSQRSLLQMFAKLSPHKGHFSRVESLSFMGVRFKYQTYSCVVKAKWAHFRLYKVMNCLVVYDFHCFVFCLPKISDLLLQWHRC